MPRDAQTLLWDMQECATLIAEFTRDRAERDFLQDRLLRSAVEGQFEILGEAMTRLAKL